MSVVPKRKLIEVALPLEAINRESAREKSIRHGHPSTLHLWWARRPLATARAVLFAQLVDDPSSRPDEFPTDEAQKTERSRLHGIMERLVMWENIGNERLFAEAHQEILKSTNGNPPAILDPFAGGGTIPLEAQRLGLEAHASDLNPVAVLINKALIEIPPRFRDQPPVFPGLADSQSIPWKGAQGLAADVRAYGEWMRDEAKRRMGDVYPKATLPDGTKAAVIAWIWARTVICPNPACGIEMPLLKSWWVGTKKGNEAYVVPSVVPDNQHASGKRVDFKVVNTSGGHDSPVGGTVTRTGAVCVACQSAVKLKHIQTEGGNKRMGARLLATVVEGPRRRSYVSPDADSERAAQVTLTKEVPDAELSRHPQYMGVPRYGLTRTSDLFTARQLLVLTTYGELVSEIHEEVRRASLMSGVPDGERLDQGGSGAAAYADALATYLALGVSRTTDLSNSLATWSSSRDQARNLFSRQAIAMAWDFVEVSPFAGAAGDVAVATDSMAKALQNVVPAGTGVVIQSDASSRPLADFLISTDPPYYDNVPYADLSDFFYVWLRWMLQDVHPGLLETMMVPKAGELVANALRQGGKDGARSFFEEGFSRVFRSARAAALSDYPIAVYYAFRQSQTADDGTSSVGWETLLDGMIKSGWAITATWPMRSERAGRMRDVGSNALASSIVLALRPRAEDASTTDRRGFIAALRAELPQALRDLQLGAIAPVDLPQAAIGPGMAVFSRFGAVIESDGSTMTVRSALARINEILDQVLNEQEGDFDPTTRFAIAWYRQYGYSTGQFGEADSVARARNISVEVMARDGILSSAAGKVTLLKDGGLRANYEVLKDARTSTWEALHHLIRVLEGVGVSAAGESLASALKRADGAVDSDLVKELAFLLFAVAEKNGWTKDAISFNTLATSWPEIIEASRSAQENTTQQVSFDFDEVS